MKYKCPTCNKTVHSSADRKLCEKSKNISKYFPFCSQRCKLIDMGAWFDAEYKIISKFENPDSIDHNKDG